MITKDNIQKVLLELKFISNHGVYTRHFGSADEGFDLEYNFNVVNSFIRMVYRQIEIQRKMNIKMRVLLFLFVLPNCLSVVIFLNISSWREEIMLVQTRDTVIFW